MANPAFGIKYHSKRKARIPVRASDFSASRDLTLSSAIPIVPRFRSGQLRSSNLAKSCRGANHRAEPNAEGVHNTHRLKASRQKRVQYSEFRASTSLDFNFAAVRVYWLGDPSGNSNSPPQLQQTR